MCQTLYLQIQEIVRREEWSHEPAQARCCWRKRISLPGSFYMKQMRPNNLHLDDDLFHLPCRNIQTE